MIELPDLEWLAFESRLKPALRLLLPRALAEERARDLALRGFAVERTDLAAPRPDGNASILYVARDLAHARALKNAEQAVVPGLPPRAPGRDVLLAHERVGALLGYPSCCVDAYLIRIGRGVTRKRSGGEASEDAVAAEDAAADTAVFHARLNVCLPDRRARLVPFYPCRFDCPVALAYADGVFAALARQAPLAADSLRAALATTVLVAPDLRIEFACF